MRTFWNPQGITLLKSKDSAYSEGISDSYMFYTHCAVSSSRLRGDLLLK